MDREGLSELPMELIRTNEELARILEGLLFAAGHEGLSSEQIADVLDLPINEIPSLCDILLKIEGLENRSFRIHFIGGAWQLLTEPYLAPYLKKLATAPPLPGLSQAALETLAIITFRQPITRAEIDQIRGVKSDRAVGTLVARGLIVEMGRAESPGRPILYETSKEFMDYFGIASLQELKLPAFLSVDE